MSGTRNLFTLLEQKVVETAVMAAAPDDANDGADITGWRHVSEFCGALALVHLIGSEATTVAAPTGGGDGVELYGYRLGKWSLISELRDGREITLSATKGYAQAVNVIGIFERLAVVGDVSAGTVTAKLGPIEAWS